VTASLITFSRNTCVRRAPMIRWVHAGNVCADVAVRSRRNVTTNSKGSAVTQKYLEYTTGLFVDKA